MLLRHRITSLLIVGLAGAAAACASASTPGPEPAPADSRAASGQRVGTTAASAPASLPADPGPNAFASTAPSVGAAAARSLAGTSTPTARPPGSANAPAGLHPAAPPPIPPNTVVLHIGDSFLLAGFAQALKPRMKSLGVRYEVRSEQSSYTVTWAGKMERLVKDTQPDLVIINLGANEIANTDPPTHAPAVKRIVKGIGGRPCVWVTPPLWRKDTGIINVIRENSAPCRFFDSDLLVPQPIPRISDKIHPTTAGGAMWAAAFYDWLLAERAPLEASAGGSSPASAGGVPASGAQSAAGSPWLLKPAPPEEHSPRPPSADAAPPSAPTGRR